MEQIGHSQGRKTETILAVSTKHWAIYILPGIATLLGLFLLIVKSYFFAGALLLYGITKILSNRSTVWVLTNEDLVIRSGFLPWRKTYFEIPKEDIYEAYYSKTMFGSFLGYATITVRRTEGSTSSFFATGMTDPGEIIGSINALVRDLKKRPQQNFVNVNAHPSLADELQKLVELKNQGLLTEEEFNAQKQKLIG